MELIATVFGILVESGFIGLCGILGAGFGFRVMFSNTFRDKYLKGMPEVPHFCLSMAVGGTTGAIVGGLLGLILQIVGVVLLWKNLTN